MQNDKEQLNILWTSDNKEVALNMLLMYAYNAIKRKWWKEINIIIWGPSVKLVSEDLDIQNELLVLKSLNINFFACKECAKLYGLEKKLTDLGIEIRDMGMPLSRHIKNGRNLLTI